MTDILASIQERVKGTFPDLLGIRFLEAAPERVRATLTVRPELCTIGDILHGGAIMAFADTLGAVATVLNLPANASTVTIESKTNFLGSAAVNTQVTGETLPLHRGKRTMVWQTNIASAEGKLLAVVIQTQMVLEK
jgi:uncharacterized protein (TIGR00369 family)